MRFCNTGGSYVEAVCFSSSETCLSSSHRSSNRPLLLRNPVFLLRLRIWSIR